MSMKYRLSQPMVTREMLEKALDSVSDGMFVGGEEVNRFEDDFARYIGTDYAVAVSSGHMGLFLMWTALPVQGKAVLTTPYTFISTASSIVEGGAVPAFVDVKSKDFNIYEERLEAAVDSSVFGISPVHLFGCPCDMDTIMDTAKKHELVVVEDACQACGAVFQGRKVGSFGIAGAFSFHPTKNMTVGGDGGMVTTNDEELMTVLRSLRNNGREAGYPNTFIRLGYTARLDTWKAAIGREQLKHLDEWNEMRRNIAEVYRRKLAGHMGVITPPLTEGAVFSQYVLIVENRDRLISHLTKEGVECKALYPLPLHAQPLFHDAGYEVGEFPTAEWLSTTALALPMHPSLTIRDVEDISEIVLQGV